MDTSVKSDNGGNEMKEEMLQQTSLNQQLPRNEVTFNFIYTSMFSNLDITKAHKVLLSSKDYEEIALLSGITEGIEPFLNVSNLCLRITYPDIIASIEWEGTNKEKITSKITISRLIRLFSSGLLSFRIQLVSKESLQFEDVVSIVRADRDHLQLYYEGEEEDKPKELFRFFERDMKRMLLNLSDGGLKCRWVDLGIEWEGDRWKEESEPCLVGEYFEYPYVVTSVKLIDHRDKTVETVVDELCQGFAGVLRAVPNGFANTKFLDSYMTHKANILPDSRAFLTLYPRSCLFVYADREEHPGKETLIGIVDTVELLKMRGHSLIITNLLLDRNIDNLRKEFQTHAAGRSSRSGALLTKMLSNIAQLRIDIAGMLEDPIAYRRATGHLSELYELGIERFRINELQNLVFLKLAQVDRLYENTSELSRRSELESLERDWDEIRKIRSKLEST